MIYFNGFSLKGEEKLFKPYLIDNEYTLIGFSYGAIKAFEYASHANKTRVDRLILLSPAFFQTSTELFKKKQLEYFELNQKVYVKQFLKNISSPSHTKLSHYLSLGTKEELHTLLTYVWNKERLEKIINNNIKIEVFLGKKDKIINQKEALSFFKSAGCTTYLLNNAGHLLLGE